MKTADSLSTDARAWRALGLVWAGVLAATALGAATLAWLGPPEATAVGGAPTTLEAAEAEEARAPEAPPARPATEEQPDPAARAVAASPPAMPAAPSLAATPGVEAATRAPSAVTRDMGPGPAAEASARAAAPAAATGRSPTTPPLPQVVTPAAMPEPAAPPLAASPVPERRGEVPLLALPATAAPGPIPPPDPGLTEASRHGPLPRIGPDGRSPARLYARAFDRSQPGPRVAVLVGGVGVSARLAEEAIARLPPEVSLALTPYAPNLAPLLAAARARGIETLMSLPFEPQGWPLNDPGDQALLTGLPMEQNLDRLFWALSRAQGQIGAVGALGPLRGERFAAQPGALEAVQRILASRGLIYVEPRPGAPGPGFSWGVAVDLVLDEPGGAAAIDARLAALEALARERGSALGYAGDASPVLVARVAAWAEGLARRGVVLAPVSALIRRPEPR
jgi:polysaccharide deacetylase 2 family uncharacterized protein YibQ